MPHAHDSTCAPVVCVFVLIIIIWFVSPAALVTQTRRMGDHGPRPFVLTPSRFQWHKFKDSLHYAVMIGLIPMGALLFYVNVFIGPAKLTKIPDGYEPKHWEYHSVRSDI